MRISLLGWRRSTLGIVTAVACASGLQITGCVRSSSRDVGADLSQRAAEAAIKAERAIADRNSRQPIFSSRKSSDTSLASKTSTGEYQPRRGAYENPLADVLASRSDSYPTDDPFIELGETQTSRDRKQLATIDLGAPIPVGSENIQLTQHQAETPLTGDGSAIAKPIAARSFPTQAATPGVNEPVSEPTVGQQQIAQRRQPSAISNAVQDRKSQFQESDLGFWKNTTAEPQVARASLGSSEDKRASHSMSNENWSQQNEHKQHVTALLKQSESQHARGELHAAYRSALLARNLVDQYQLDLSAGDVDPATVAKEISAQIWGTSSKKARVAKKPLATKKKVDDELPIITPRQTRSIQHDQVFQTPDSYLNWQASDEIPSENHLVQPESSIVSEDAADEPQDSESTLNVRSALFASTTDAVSPSDQHPISSSAIQQTGNFITSQVTQHEWVSEAADLLVEHQPAVSKIASSQRLPEASIAKPMPKNVLPPSREDFSTPTRHDLARGPLLAPIQERNPFEADLVQSQADALSVEVEPLPEFETVVSEEQPTGRLKWGVIAFILATLSTLVGLKLNRNPTFQSAEGNEDQDEPAEQSIRISKAA